MTKSEIKGLPVDELRSLLQEHFEGIPDDATKKQLKDVVDEQWDVLEPLFASPEPDEPEEDETDAEEEGKEGSEEGEEVEEVEPDEKARLLSKDLYTGNPPPHLR